MSHMDRQMDGCTDRHIGQKLINSGDNVQYMISGRRGWHSSLIDSGLVDVIVPFLPLEREHVRMCIRDELEAQGCPFDEHHVNKVKAQLQFVPKDKPFFSKTGCKTVPEKIKELNCTKIQG